MKKIVKNIVIKDGPLQKMGRLNYAIMNDGSEACMSDGEVALFREGKKRGETTSFIACKDKRTYSRGEGGFSFGSAK